VNSYLCEPKTLGSATRWLKKKERGAILEAVFGQLQRELSRVPSNTVGSLKPKSLDFGPDIMVDVFYFRFGFVPEPLVFALQFLRVLLTQFLYLFCEAGHLPVDLGRTELSLNLKPGRILDGLLDLTRAGVEKSWRVPRDEIT